MLVAFFFFSVQKLLIFFNQKYEYIYISHDINFNVLLTNVISFELLGPGVSIHLKIP